MCVARMHDTDIDLIDHRYRYHDANARQSSSIATAQSTVLLMRWCVVIFSALMCDVSRSKLPLPRRSLLTGKYIGNPVQEIPEQIGQFTSLTRLDFSRCQLEWLPVALTNFKPDTVMDFRDNFNLMLPPKVSHPLYSTRLVFVCVCTWACGCS